MKALDPGAFLKEAWTLIQNAREHVLRPQTEVESLSEQGGGREALAKVMEYIDRKQRIAFARL